MGRLAAIQDVCLVCLIAAGCSKPARQRHVDEVSADLLSGKIIPLIEEFRQRHGLDFQTVKDTNRISHLSVDVVPERSAVLANVVIDKTHDFFLHQEGGPMYVWLYQRNPSTWLSDYSNITPEKRKVLSQLTNVLNDETALALAQRAFRAQGHAETNFKPVQFKQIIWSYNDKDTDLLKLPFYEAVWFRRDADLKAYAEGDIRQPDITIDVSGVISNIVYYARHSMPREGGDWGTGKPPPLK